MVLSVAHTRMSQFTTAFPKARSMSLIWNQDEILFEQNNVQYDLVLYNCLDAVVIQQ